MNDETHLNIDWSTEATAARRDTYYAASQQKFVPFKDPIVFKKGSMQYLWDAEGNKYTDLLGMNVCISVGHSHPRVVSAAMEQAQELTHCTTMFHHPVPAHFAEEFAATMPKGKDDNIEWVVHFTNSGSEAVDLAMAVARTFTGNLDLLALRSGYHGPTSGAQSITGIANFRHPGMSGNVAFVPEPNQYRGIFGKGADPYLDEIDQTIRAATTGRVAGIFVESVQGYGGIIEMPKGYMSGAAERVRAAGGLYIADEVQSGFGRTGDNMWGFEADGVIPDIVVMAKGIGNGFPLGAVVTQKHIAAPMAEKFMFHTYGANPTCCAAGRAVLAVIRDEKLQPNAKNVGNALLARLKDLQDKHKAIGDVRGRGLMLAIEMVKDRKTKEPDPETTAAVFENCRESGLILSKSGQYQSVLRMVPPLCLSMDDVDTVANGLDRAFSALR
ncbi:aspartate aminotransferase family protein [Pseudohalocynthiibacter aestuariivivens]|jgi:alanine-glyoxylate transaminase / (R)-3-amino-2-methylpropionate-pyruvate transaminase|uniref:alanine--glyoxylate transaminase n=1 Tax=Pseudohalocynthiibacter aestuariivivens TaxID=1591409 RepID=A0ABV5JJ78_9RHOB|nr:MULTISPECIES: aspartate aminotransferase family protein [Pseudohalocynthiibacter]MBS9716130.1 aspartate aminotransferase family protein [Pseudohalocynthiibacter aestuariivivens]MCK0101062.1 aspartate aminotransferase family protein [Pseudohalocynthiibacter sp. F2068]